MHYSPLLQRAAYDTCQIDTDVLEKVEVPNKVECKMRGNGKLASNRYPYYCNGIMQYLDLRQLFTVDKVDTELVHGVANYSHNPLQEMMD